MKKIFNCRVCQSKNLHNVLSLGNQFLTGIFPKSKNEKTTIGPLELVWCQDCQLVQINHSFDLSEMYGENYGYRSGLNNSMVEHLNSKIHHLESKVHLSAGDCVIDIGSNDATTLKAYTTPGLKKIGIDPTGLKFKDYYTDAIQLIPDFFPSKEVHKAINNSKVKIITSIAMFYDLENPITFVQSIHDILDDDGIWHFEQSYLPSMLRLNSYDTICHEHLEYYSLYNIRYILEKTEMKIIDVQMNAVNGGSFAVTAAKKKSPLKSNDALINWLFKQETKMCLHTPSPFRNFEENVFNHRDALKSLVNTLNQNGKKIFGYGASTKGNVVLQFCNFNSDDIKCIAEINPEKFGSFTPGTGIPIVSEAEAGKNKPDYYLVLPWHFKDGIIRNGKKFLHDGGKFIFPFPEIEIIGG